MVYSGVLDVQLSAALPCHTRMPTAIKNLQRAGDQQLGRWTPTTISGASEPFDVSKWRSSVSVAKATKVRSLTVAGPENVAYVAFGRCSPVSAKTQILTLHCDEWMSGLDYLTVIADCQDRPTKPLFA
jgi:hypothetical protein